MFTGSITDNSKNHIAMNKKPFSRIIQNDKIKSFILILLISFSLAGCTDFLYDSFQQFDDEFKNSRKNIARLVLYPEERRTEINSASVIIEKEMLPGQELTKAYFVISRSSYSFRLEKTAFMKAAGQSFEINIAEPLTEYRSKKESSVSTNTTTDSTGVKTSETTNFNEYNWIDDKFVFELTPEMVSAINKSEEFIVRFYLGPIPATFKFKGSGLSAVHKALAD